MWSSVSSSQRILSLWLDRLSTDRIEQAGVGRLVLGHGRESWMHGAGLRQCEARRESKPLRCGIDRQQEIEVAALAEDDEGRRCFTPLPCDAVGRKPIQPQAQNAL